VGLFDFLFGSVVVDGGFAMFFVEFDEEGFVGKKELDSCVSRFR
jgi:hypothetical protein